MARRCTSYGENHFTYHTHIGFVIAYFQFKIFGSICVINFHQILTVQECTVLVKSRLIFPLQIYLRARAFCVIIPAVRGHIYETIKMAFRDRPVLQNLFGQTACALWHQQQSIYVFD